ncbi:hypothetical protein IQ07DRAFT_412686 [Pyrenochaeta sp. DS3sAY3a]|nr:hypothetical protein IQ07DRAFT_412686 [Pyrenochaeta sp. DS3sAY3a]
MSETKVEYKIWSYNPSLAGGVIACVSFFALTGIHAFRLFRNRTWFCLPFVIGGLFEAVGYAARAAAHNHIHTTMPSVIQSLLILIAPILFAASIYMILGRIIISTESASLTIIRPSRLTKIFVAGDIFCFLIQSGGAGILSQAKDQASRDRGEHIILGGLILQILFFGFFVIIAGKWHRRLKDTVTAASTKIPWQRFILLLYLASGFITIRNVCRAAEYAMGRVSSRIANICA